MITEQGGAPSASAGGAPAPDPNAVDNALAGTLIDQYGFLPLSVRYRAAAAARAVTESWTRSKPVPDAEILPADRKPVLGEPGIQTEWDEDVDAMRVDGVGWDLSWGCKLSLAYDHERGEHYVCVSTSDQDQRAGITTRRTTKEQIASFGQQLLNVFGEPDPRDAEIERLRDDAEEANTWRIRAINAEQDLTDAEKCRAEVLRWTKIAGGQAEEIERLRAQVDELAGIRVALFAEVRQALVERDEARARVEELETQRDRRQGLWQARYGQLIGGALAVQQHLQRAAGKPVPAGEEFDKDYSRSMVDGLRIDKERAESERNEAREQAGAANADMLNALASLCDGIVAPVAELTAERDRLRLEVASARSIAEEKRAVAEKLRGQVDKLAERLAKVYTQRDNLRAEVEQTTNDAVRAIKQCLSVESERDRLRQELDLAIQQRQNVARAVAQALSLPIGEDKKPAEPRRWVAGDPEPEVGTTVRQSGDWGAGPTWTSRQADDWHCNSHCLRSDVTECPEPGRSWAWLSGHVEALVEVADR